MKNKGKTIIVKGKKAGKTTLTATATDGSKQKATVDIVVVNTKSKIKKVTSVKAVIEKSELNVGETTKVTAKVEPSKATLKRVYYSSSDSKKAQVDANGKVTALQAGTVKITAKAQDESKKSSFVMLTIKNKPTVQPTAKPTTKPGVSPTVEPTKQAVEPTETPSIIPTAEATKVPSVTPTAEATKVPSVTPTAEPTEPVATPTEGEKITETPSVSPTAVVTAPAAEPTTEITISPVATPTESVKPTTGVSVSPTQKPTEPTKAPTPTEAENRDLSDDVKIINSTTLWFYTEKLNSISLAVYSAEGNRVGKAEADEYDGEKYVIKYPIPVNEYVSLRISDIDQGKNERVLGEVKLQYNKVPVLATSIASDMRLEVQIREDSVSDKPINPQFELKDEQGEEISYNLDKADWIDSITIGNKKIKYRIYGLDLSASLLKDKAYSLKVSMPEENLGDYTEEIVYSSTGSVKGKVVAKDGNGGFVSAGKGNTEDLEADILLTLMKDGVKVAETWANYSDGEFEFLDVPVGEYKLRVTNGWGSFYAPQTIDSVLVKKDEVTTVGEENGIVLLRAKEKLNLLAENTKVVLREEKDESGETCYYAYVKEGITKTEILENVSVSQFGTLRFTKDGKEYTEEAIVDGMSIEVYAEAGNCSQTWDIHCVDNTEFIKNAVKTLTLSKGEKAGTVTLCGVMKGMKYVTFVPDKATEGVQIPTGALSKDITADGKVSISVKRNETLFVYVGEDPNNPKGYTEFKSETVCQYIKRDEAPSETDYIIDDENCTIVPNYKPGEKLALEYSFLWCEDESDKKFNTFPVSEDGKSYLPVSYENKLNDWSTIALRYVGTEEKLPSEIHYKKMAIPAKDISIEDGDTICVQNRLYDSEYAVYFRLVNADGTELYKFNSSSDGYNCDEGRRFMLNYPLPLGSSFQLKATDGWGDITYATYDNLKCEMVPVANVSLSAANQLQVDIRAEAGDVEFTVCDSNGNKVNGITPVKGNAYKYTYEDPDTYTDIETEYSYVPYQLNFDSDLTKDMDYTLKVTQVSGELTPYEQTFRRHSTGSITGTVVKMNEDSGKLEEYSDYFRIMLKGNGINIEEYSSGESSFTLNDIPIGTYTLEIEGGEGRASVEVTIEKDNQTVSAGQIRVLRDESYLYTKNPEKIQLVGDRLYVTSELMKDELFDMLGVTNGGSFEIVQNGVTYTKDSGENVAIIAGAEIKVYAEFGNNSDYYQVEILDNESYLVQALNKVSLTTGTEANTVKLCGTLKGMKYGVLEYCDDDYCGKDVKELEIEPIEITENGDIDNIYVSRLGGIVVYCESATGEVKETQMFYGYSIEDNLKKEELNESDYIIDYVKGTIVPAAKPGEGREMVYEIYSDYNSSGYLHFTVVEGKYQPVDIREYLNKNYTNLHLKYEETDTLQESTSVEIPLTTYDTAGNLNTLISDTSINTENGTTMGAIPDTVWYTNQEGGFSEDNQGIQGTNSQIPVKSGEILYFRTQLDTMFWYVWKVEVPELTGTPEPTMPEVTPEVTEIPEPTTGTIQGTVVVSDSGKLVSFEGDYNVVLTNDAGEKKEGTCSGGKFILKDIPAGNYTLQIVGKTGESELYQNVTVTAGETVTVGGADGIRIIRSGASLYSTDKTAIQVEESLVQVKEGSTKNDLFAKLVVSDGGSLEVVKDGEVCTQDSNDFEITKDMKVQINVYAENKKITNTYTVTFAEITQTPEATP